MLSKNNVTAPDNRFPRAFYVANLMEIFERIAWYGFFTVSSLYMTSSPASGGLGLSDPQRGVLQGLIPFFVYILPVFTGALGDRVGYKRMFIIAFAILIPSYYLLGWVSGFWPFFLAYFFVALGAAIFKPLVVGTVARSANDSNRGIAFGVFFMMVNIGGFIGPIIAGSVRAISWDLVFILSSSAMAINLLIVLLLFKDDNEKKSGGASEALGDVREILGNTRFALLVAPIILAFMLAGGEWISYRDFVLFVVALFIFNGVWNLFARNTDGPWHSQKLQVGNGPFLTYLLVLSLFWAAYNQIFITLPLYLRDFVDTGDLVSLAGAISPWFANFISPLNVEGLAAALPQIAEQYAASSGEGLRDLRLAIAEYQVRPPADAITGALATIAANPQAVETVATDWARDYRQVSPEYIIAIDFLSIVSFQYFVSRTVQKLPPFAILVAGSLLIGFAYAFGGLAHAVPYAGLLAIASVFVFAFGEMLASPKSQEYVASIAPREKSALFMGYYFVSMALGFLFAGIFSGWAYDLFALKMNQPFLMWAFFAGLAGLAAIALMIFNKVLAPQMTASTMSNS